MITSFLSQRFKFESKSTNFKTELMAGLTTFSAMAYILMVNPAILSAGGMPKEGLVTVTGLAAAFGCVLMGLMTNYPIAMAPGMGLNAFFAFTMCLGRGLSWEAAMGIVFWNGILFVLLSISGLRSHIAKAIPSCLKIGVQCGIGLFIAFIGLKNASLIVANPATFVSLGDLAKPEPVLTLLGIILTVVLVSKKVPGAILIPVLLLAFTSILLFPGHPAQEFTLFGLPESIQPTFLQLDILYPLKHIFETWDLIFALVFVNMFDTIGTLIGVSRKANLLDIQGELPKLGPAMTADALASVGGSLLGTSPVTSYVESAAGVSEGGKTGFTALVVAFCFLLSLFFTPLIQQIPLFATSPALVMLGIYMMESIRQLDFESPVEAATCVICMISMPLSFSISEGIALGFVCYAGMMLLSGNYKKVSLVSYGLAFLFIIRFIIV